MSNEVSNAQVVTPMRVLLFAFCCAALTANLYYLQPLTALLASSFAVQLTWAGYLVSAIQFGYVIGVVFIVPLSDVVNHRRLVAAMLACNVVSLLLASVSHTFPMFAAASLCIGVSSSAVMVLLATVASYAPEKVRGKYLGTVMTGLLLGILLARTVAGFVVQWAGSWRAIYLIAAGLVSCLLAVLWTQLPAEERHGEMRYRALLASLVQLIKDEPLLRQRALFSALGLGTFSVLWTCLTFLLSGPPYHYSESTIGLFGLAGAAGAMAASGAGRLADRGYAFTATWTLAIATLAAWGFILAGSHSLAALLIGIVILDIGVMGLQVTHQSVIYRLAPQARGRVTTVFIAAGFIGASVGSSLASIAFAMHGWLLTCVVGAALPALLVGIWLTQGRREAFSSP
ncbi:MFS transporter [Paraburkholderia dipogonis]|uniref:MFS transporter n=1 Tax=Paraburkholderia dipogonis TaxID=1211383 RepID=UPI0038B8E2F7